MTTPRTFAAAAVVALALVAPLTARADEIPVDAPCPPGSTLDPFGAGQCVDDQTGAVVGSWGTDGTYTTEPVDELPDVDVEVLGSEAYRPTPADVNDLPIPPTPIAQTPAFTG